MSELKDPFNGKRGRQKGQTKDLVVIKDEAIAPYEIHIDQSCYILVEPVVSEGKQFTLREYINEYKQVVENLKQTIKI